MNVRNRGGELIGEIEHLDYRFFWKALRGDEPIAAGNSSTLTEAVDAVEKASFLDEATRNGQ